MLRGCPRVPTKTIRIKQLDRLLRGVHPRTGAALGPFTRCWVGSLSAEAVHEPSTRGLVRLGLCVSSSCVDGESLSQDRGEERAPEELVSVGRSDSAPVSEGVCSKKGPAGAGNFGSLSAESGSGRGQKRGDKEPPNLAAYPDYDCVGILVGLSGDGASEGLVSVGRSDVSPVPAAVPDPRAPTGVGDFVKLSPRVSSGLGSGKQEKQIAEHPPGVRNFVQTPPGATEIPPRYCKRRHSDAALFAEPLASAHLVDDWDRGRSTKLPGRWPGLRLDEEAWAPAPPRGTRPTPPRPCAGFGGEGPLSPHGCAYPQPTPPRAAAECAREGELGTPLTFLGSPGHAEAAYSPAGAAGYGGEGVPAAGASPSHPQEGSGDR